MSQKGALLTVFNGRSSFSPKRKRFGIHGYIYMAGHAVYRNIFLDGNTFRESHRVDKNLFVADIISGVALTYKLFKLSYAYVCRTRQFKTQPEPHIFGTGNISLTY